MWGCKINMQHKSDNEHLLWHLPIKCVNDLNETIHVNTNVYNEDYVYFTGN